MSDIARIQAILTEITKLQAEVIDDLFLLLMQHITAEEADRLPVIDKINRAANLHKEIDGR